MSSDNGRWYLCAAEKDGKVTDISFCNNIYAAIEYKMSRAKKSESVSIYAVDYDHVGGMKDSGTHVCEQSSPVRVHPKNEDWATRILCLETGVVYNSIRECSLRTGISHFRIRTAVAKDCTVEGFHFVKINNGKRKRKDQSRD